MRGADFILFFGGGTSSASGSDGGVDPLAPGGPTIEVETPVANPPVFLLGLVSGQGAPLDTVEGDVVQIGYASQTVDFESDPLTSDDILNGIEHPNGVMSIAERTPYARIKRPGSPDRFSTWASGAPYTVPDATAPVLSNASATSTGENTADLSVDTDEANGTLYWVVTESNTPPSKAQVKAGEDENGDPAADDGDQAVSSTGTQNITGGASGLDAATNYHVYFMHEDATGNQSDVATDDFTTNAGAGTPANTVAPVISGNTQVGQTLSTTDGTWTNTPTGYAYQWKRDGSDISGATNSTYDLVEADAGADITCEVTASNGAGAGAPASSNTLAIDVYAVQTDRFVSAADSNNYSGGDLNGVNIGVDTPNRTIVVAIGARGTGVGQNATLSAATVGGNATTQRLRVTSDSGNNKVEWRTLAPGIVAGTSANLAFAWVNAPQSGVQSRMSIAVWAVYGAASDTPSDSESSTSEPSGTMALTVPAKGVGLGYSFSISGTSVTWTGLNEDFQETVESTTTHSAATLNSNAGGTINTTVDWDQTLSNVPIHAIVAFGP